MPLGCPALSPCDHGLGNQAHDILVCGPALSQKFVGCLGNQLALETCAFELNRAGLALTLTAGNGGGAIGAATDHFVQCHLPLEAVGQAHNGHAEVHQVGDDGEKCDLLLYQGTHP